MEEYALASTEVAYLYPGQQTPTGLMASGGEFCESGNASHWLDQKHPSFNSPTSSENTKWDTTSIYIYMVKEAIRKDTGRVNVPLE